MSSENIIAVSDEAMPKHENIKQELTTPTAYSNDGQKISVTSSGMTKLIEAYSFSDDETNSDNENEHDCNLGSTIFRNPSVKNEAKEDSSLTDVLSNVHNNQASTRTDLSCVSNLQNSAETSDKFVSSMLEAVASIESEPSENESDEISSESSEEESSSETESSSSESSSEDNDEQYRQARLSLQKLEEEKKTTEIGFGSILLETKPEIKNVDVVLPGTVALQVIGEVNSIIDDNVVVIKAIPNKPALNLDSVLFLENRSVLGRIYETFGPVSAPYYVVCFEEGKIHAGVAVNQKVYSAPEIGDFTSYVLTAQLKVLRGSDASWLDDREPPDNAVEYSDDEAERNAKRQKKKRKAPPDNKPIQGDAPNARSRQNRGRGNWTNRSVSIRNPHAQLQDSDVGWMNAVTNIQHYKQGGGPFHRSMTPNLANVPSGPMFGRGFMPGQIPSYSGMMPNPSVSWRPPGCIPPPPGDPSNILTAPAHPHMFPPHSAPIPPPPPP
ncbi:unnamed protein product [Clavelina lepadiformis]|uniref:H/ACA ribonucleoprotein complex non-core subunit NAF1 n=1 Tax=Clavelina lepadiformis TaxID=159417 RepID=A0ABP0GMX4_CLALP